MMKIWGERRKKCTNKVRFLILKFFSSAASFFLNFNMSSRLFGKRWKRKVEKVNHQQQSKKVSQPNYYNLFKRFIYLL
jgi:hypothetical protein